MRATRQRAAKPAAPAPVVVRLHEASGASRTGWDAALKAAVKTARTEVGDPVAVEIARQWADLGPRGIAQYHVHVKVAYRQSLAAPKRASGAAGGPRRKKSP